MRDWIYVEDHVRALWAVLNHGRAGQVYNIGSDNEVTNQDVVEQLRKLMGLPGSIIQPVADRLGHDRRYAIDAAKVRQELDWEPKMDWTMGLQSTVEWYKSHRSWWDTLRNMV